MQPQTFTEFYNEYIRISPPRSKIDGIVKAEKKYFASLMPLSKRIRLVSNNLITAEDMSNDLPYMDYMQKNEYFRAIVLLENAVNNGLIGKDHLEGKVLDFGCGFGGSSLLLSRFSDNVEAIDINDEKLGKLERTLFPGKIINGDGLIHMKQKPKHYDLITAFFLGTYDTAKDFIDDFHRYSRHAISDNGRILICSDLLTMDKVREVFSEYMQIKFFPELIVSPGSNQN